MCNGSLWIDQIGQILATKTTTSITYQATTRAMIPSLGGLFAIGY